jgi:hypothetical protein
MMFGQTRIFFTMARDGLLPRTFAKIHPRFHAPCHHADDRVGRGIGNSLSSSRQIGGLLQLRNSFAFAMVAVAVLVRARCDPARQIPFPHLGDSRVAPLAILGRIYIRALIAKLVLPRLGRDRAAYLFCFWPIAQSSLRRTDCSLLCFPSSAFAQAESSADPYLAQIPVIATGGGSECRSASSQ